MDFIELFISDVTGKRKVKERTHTNWRVRGK